jgi:hypothetical protein
MTYAGIPLLKKPRIGFYANLQSAGKNQPPKHG